MTCHACYTGEIGFNFVVISFGFVSRVSMRKFGNGLERGRLNRKSEVLDRIDHLAEAIYRILELESPDNLLEEVTDVIASSVFKLKVCKVLIKNMNLSIDKLS